MQCRPPSSARYRYLEAGLFTLVSGTSSSLWAQPAADAAYARPDEQPAQTEDSQRSSSPSNTPPQIVRLLPERYDRPSIVAKLGHRLSITVVVRDQEGDPIRVSAAGLPRGALFSPEAQRLVWLPDQSQRGEHSVVLRASDGQKETTRVISLHVTDNRPPSFFQRSYSVTVGQQVFLAFLAKDADADDLEFRLHDLPQGGSFDSQTGILSWRPRDFQVGKHYLRVSVSDGTVRTTQQFRISVAKRSNDAWGTFFLPGGALSHYRPRASDSLGSFTGGAFTISLVSWIHRTEDAGPSHGRIYLRGDLAASSKRHVPAMFAYAAGLSLSLEKNPSRRSFIPVYGLEAGGFVHQLMGNPFFVTPYAGLHLFADRDVFITARGGYRLVPSQFTRLSGWHAVLAADVGLW